MKRCHRFQQIAIYRSCIKNEYWVRLKSRPVSYVKNNFLSLSWINGVVFSKIKPFCFYSDRKYL